MTQKQAHPKDDSVRNGKSAAGNFVTEFNSLDEPVDSGVKVHQKGVEQGSEKKERHKSSEMLQAKYCS